MNSSSFKQSQILALAILSFLALNSSAQTSFKFAAINFPGSKSTTANGINNANVIVGSYVSTAGHNFGFRLQNGHFTTINVPGSTQTLAFGINDLGDVVGAYSLPGTPSQPANEHGFLLHNGVFKTIDFPGAQFTQADGINKFGTIVGSYENAHGFVLQGGKFRTVDAPTNGNPATNLTGISNLGEITGDVFSGDNFRGFWIVGTSDLDFLKPFLARDNIVEGANGRGDIVGCNINLAFLAHNPESGEVEGSERFPTLRTIMPFGGNNSCAMSINYARAIVGWFSDAQFTQHGFLAIPQ